MKKSLKAVLLPVKRLQEFVNSTAKKPFEVIGFGEVNDDVVDKIIAAIKGGSKLPNTYHFMGSAVVIYRSGKVQGGK